MFSVTTHIYIITPNTETSYNHFEVIIPFELSIHLLTIMPRARANQYPRRG